MPSRLAIGLLCGLTLWLQPSARAQSTGEKLRLTAVAVNLNTPGPNAAQPIEIQVDSFSTAGQRAELIRTAVQEDQDELLKALQKQPKRGRMWAPQWQGPDPLQARLGWDLRYAFQTPTDEGGRRI